MEREFCYNFVISVAFKVKCHFVLVVNGITILEILSLLTKNEQIFVGPKKRSLDSL